MQPATLEWEHAQLDAGRCRHAQSGARRLRPGGGLPNPAFRFDRRACFPVPTWQRPSHGAQRRSPRHGRPEIFKYRPGERVHQHGVHWPAVGISMDGRGSWRDNVFVERLWRSVKYEEVCLRAYDSVAEARSSIGGYLAFYNRKRPHSSLDGRMPTKLILAAWRWRRPHDVRRQSMETTGRETNYRNRNAVQTNPATSTCGLAKASSCHPQVAGRRNPPQQESLQHLRYWSDLGWPPPYDNGRKAWICQLTSYAQICEQVN